MSRENDVQLLDIKFRSLPTHSLLHTVNTNSIYIHKILVFHICK